jgi:hypothetical protein
MRRWEHDLQVGAELVGGGDALGDQVSAGAQSKRRLDTLITA